MKLYFSKGACSLAVRILIHELGLSSEFESVNLKTKQTEAGEDFLKINPKGAVPVLVTDKGQTLTENAVIHQYLTDQNQPTTLLPDTNDFNRYRVLEWLNYISTDLHKGFGPLFNPHVPPETKNDVFKSVLKSKMKYVNEQISQHKFLLGNEFTSPDAYLFVILTWLKNFQIDIQEWPNLARYFEDLKKRKSVQQSLLEEGLSI